jgi:tripartite-type tricarboxylate transporter receptor subunit TctC
MKRRAFLHLAAGAAVLPLTPHVARAQAYPTRTITLIVPFPPGGTTDLIARLVAEHMRASMGQPVVIENIGGADGSIGIGRAARARGDGYTLCVGTADTQVLNAAFYSLPYDVSRDFTPIAPLATTPIVLFGRKSIPASDLGELVSWLKARSEQASAGMNSLGFRLIAQFFQTQTETRFTIIPYRAAGPQREDFIAGRTDLLFGLPLAFSMLPEGSAKAFAVTSDRRLTLAPDVPTFAEQGFPSLVYSGWYGLFAPKGTPKDIVEKLNAAALEALADPAAQSRFGKLGFEMFPGEQQTPEALAAMQKADAAKWWPIIKQLGIRAE